MKRLRQIDELTWKRAGRFLYAWVVVNEGEEIGLRYRLGQDRPHVEVRAAESADLSPHEMVRLLLDEAELDEAAIRWIADAWA